MNILIYSYNFLPKDRGGMEKYLLSLVQRLKNKHKIVLVLPNRHNISLNNVKIYNIHGIKVKSDIKNTLGFTSLFLSSLSILSSFISTFIILPFILIKNKIDIINVFQPSPNASAVISIARLFRKKSIINLRGLEGDASLIYQLSLDFTFLFSNMIIINSRDLLKRYIQTSHLPKFLFSKKKGYYLPNGINTDYWKPDKTEKIDKKFDLVFVGNLADKSQIKNKGIKFLYEAIRILSKNNLNLKVVVIGHANMHLLKKIIAPDIKNYFDFDGFVENYGIIKNKLQKSRIFVLPSVSEGMPNSLMEAMALEIPCIASNVGGVPELIENNVDGLTFESKNSRKLADLIRLLLEDENLQKKLGINARKKMVDKFNWNQIITKLEILYGKL
ncbi:hypothetical protein LCGC14_0732250 [marine sediment metagenome]|uniref:Glycosyl transferase family 1 domain-containing protein n=1 Tax=marine sediment metagenome TaxID=412755 RepID=A0A0F9TGF2_9ZZZZ